eukprot:346651-Pleurochrysis_carterae.AAC.1
MPDSRLKFQSWSRSMLMLSRWKRRAHHPHRSKLGGRALWMNIRNGEKTCQLAMEAMEARTRRNQAWYLVRDSLSAKLKNLSESTRSDKMFRL